MQKYIERLLTGTLKRKLKENPVTALLGPRQCGKSTLAKTVLSNLENTLFLDLEKHSDLNKLRDPELFFSLNKDKLICLDEIQRTPEMFRYLRVSADATQKNGQFLILGSASYELLKQSSETLAGRIAYIELTPFLYEELKNNPDSRNNFFRLWLHGGFPRSTLAISEEASYEWRLDFIRTFLERDIPGLGIRIQSSQLHRFWRMLAHVTAQVLNKSKLASSLGVSSHAITRYVDLLSQTYMLRVLEPFYSNEKKRVIKSPKIYIRDSGILHALMNIKSLNDLFAHPIYGQSWEGFAIEQIISSFPNIRFSYYRNSDGNEIDLIFQYKRRCFAVECKASSSPKVQKGFNIVAETIKATDCWIIAPVDRSYPYDKSTSVGTPADIIKYIKKL
ncbi:MAG: ATP-binding protein [Candidatus Omnitrophica bacterium]|nr:ATP-binding protein [Candidatus Omnitrophota bacterium]